ncbi:MAG: alkaline phosphatase family protein, partial [Acidobacteriota bacterium]
MFKKAAPLVIVPLLLLLWARLGAQPLALFSFNALVNYPSPFTDPIPPGKEADPVSKQVVLVMVDALRADTSRTMPAVNALRRQGGDCTAQVGLPSFSLPGWTVIGTGAWQEQSGVTLNFYKGAVKVDSIFDAAKRKGLTTAIVAQSGSWKQLFPRNVDWNESFQAPEDSHHHLPQVRRVDDQVEAAALKSLKENKPNLLLYYLAEPDDAGHGKGAASPEYRDAALATDARIARLVSTLNLNESTLVVTADHGMLDVGGHGGNEPVVTTVPIVLAGKGIKPGSQCSNGRQADIAPTLAVLLGTSIPTHNQGRPLLEMLDMPAAARSQRAVDTAQEIADRYAPVAKILGASPFEHKKLEEAKASLAGGNADTATGAALADIENTNAQFAAARDARLWQERLGRLPIALLILLPIAFYFWVMWRMKWGWRAPIAGLLTYLVVY